MLEAKLDPLSVIGQVTRRKWCESRSGVASAIMFVRPEESRNRPLLALKNDDGAESRAPYRCPDRFAAPQRGSHYPGAEAAQLPNPARLGDRFRAGVPLGWPRNLQAESPLATAINGCIGDLALVEFSKSHLSMRVELAHLRRDAGYDLRR